jgi:hypothetical protein
LVILSKENSCSFVLLILNESYDVIHQTIESIIFFRLYAASVLDSEFICVYGGSDSSVLAKLYEDADYVSPPNFQVVDKDNWKMQHFGESKAPPEVFNLFLEANFHNTSKAMFLIKPGVIIEDEDALLHSIQEVCSNPELIVISPELESEALPLSAVFNTVVPTSSLNLTTGNMGFPVMVKKRFFGGFQLVRDDSLIYPTYAKLQGSGKKVLFKPEVSWLIAAIAFDYASGQRPDLELTTSKWTNVH